MSQIKMTILSGEIYYLETQLKNLQQKHQSTFAQQEQQVQESTDIQAKISTTEAQLKEQERQFEIKQTEISQLEHDNALLKEKTNELFHASQEALLQKTGLESQLSSLQFNLKDPSLTVSQLKLSIMQYQAVINQPEPKPEYKIDGEYCINGIYHCQNHPPRQILINEKEISAHQEAVQSARRAIQQLQQELYKCDQEYNTLQQQADRLSRAIEAANNKYENLQAELASTQNEIANNQTAIKQAKNEFEQLFQGKNHLDYELTQLKTKLSYLSQQSTTNLDIQLMQIQNQIDIVSAQLEQKKLEYQSMQEQAMLEQMARQELMEEARAGRGVSGQTNYANSNTHILEQLARTELDAENNNKISPVTSLPDQLMDAVIDGAHRAGKIPEQVRQNLRNIHGFLNKQIKHMEQDFNKLEQDFFPNNKK